MLPANNQNLLQFSPKKCELYNLYQLLCKDESQECSQICLELILKSVMKNIIRIFSIKVLVVLSIITLSPVSIYADNTPITNTNAGNWVESQSRINSARIDEINNMDKSNLSRREKRALRNEVKSIYAASSSDNGGIYLSVGAVIIILLLLILLL